MVYFIQGLLIGFSIAAPVGPIGVLCIKRTLIDGRSAGFVSGLGAATADAFYGLIAGLGLTVVAQFLTSQELWFRLIGGLFLCYLALKTFRAAPAEQAAATHGNGLFNAYLSTALLTLTNPATILSFAAVFAGLGVGQTQSDYLQAGLLVLGVFLGSAAWWLILSGSVSLIRDKFDTRRLIWVNRISGVIIGIFGVLALGSLIR